MSNLAALAPTIATPILLRVAAIVFISYVGSVRLFGHAVDTLT